VQVAKANPAAFDEGAANKEEAKWR